jgi:hypothetical protein
MTNKESDNKLPFQFVIFPKRIASDFRNGDISPNQWKLYMWLRLNMNPYGITTTSISSIREDIFKGVGLSYVRRLLLELRSNKYLYFEDHQGRGGSFEIKFGELKTPDNVIVSIEHYFVDKKVTTEDKENTKANMEASHNFESKSHKSEVQETPNSEGDLANTEQEKVTSHYNENKMEKKNDNYNSSTTLNEKRETQSYIPQNDNEARCKEIAIEVGDEYVDFILSALYHKYGGIEIIEKAFRYFQNVLRIAEEKGDVEPIVKPPAFFNTCVKNAISDNELKITGKW